MLSLRITYRFGEERGGAESASANTGRNDEMAERIRWRQLHEAAQLEVERLKKELFDAVNNGLSLAKENDELRSKVDDLTKAVERARIVGMNEATGLILRSDNP
jgi:hypothetical protein